MPALLTIYGIFGSCLLSVLVGLIGSHRKIGFGWTFFLSVLLSPLLGLVFALISKKLPKGERRWGILGAILAVLTVIFIILFVVYVLGIAIV